MTEGVGRDRAAYERDGELVLAARAGDDTAFAELFNRWFDSVYDAARRVVGDKEVAAEVAQDTFLAVWKKLGDLREPSTFGAFALRTARNRALNRSERERRSVAVDDQDLVPVIDRARPSVDTGDVVTQNEGDALVWAASVALGDRDASLLDLHLRHGLSAPELADEMGVTANNAHQLLFRMKKKLGVAIEGWVLWRGGSPSCLSLQGDLERAGVTGFSAEAVRVINRHVSSCHECDERKAAMLAPEALFAAVPIAVAAPGVREGVAQALRTLGVPVTAEAPAAAGGGDPSNGSSPSTEAGSTAGPAPASPSSITSSSTSALAANAAALPDHSSTTAETSEPDHANATRRLVVAGVALLALLLLVGGGVVLSRSTTPAVLEAATATTVDPGGTPTPPTAATGSGPVDSAEDPSPVATDATTAEANGGETDPTGDPRSGSPSSTVPGNLNTPTTSSNPNGSPQNDPNVIVTVTVTQPPPGPNPNPNVITVPSTTTTTSPAPPPPPPPPPGPPTINAFSGVVQSLGPPCGSAPPQRRILLSWTTSDATGVTIAGPGAPAGTQAANGSVTVCALGAGPSTYVLTASGPNGPPDTELRTV